jgi:hypothetical protein
MSYYVKRLREGTATQPARVGWTGPVRSERQARREVAAWESVGWVAWAEESTPAVKAEVRAWVKARKLAHDSERWSS